MIAGELLFEPIERAPYAIDASLYEIDPLGVIVPPDRRRRRRRGAVRGRERARDSRARGGDGRGGGDARAGLVIDFSRHFRRIVEIRAEHVVVEPGVVLDVLERAAGAAGPAAGSRSGRSERARSEGMIGSTRRGPRSLRTGPPATMSSSSGWCSPTARSPSSATSPGPASTTSLASSRTCRAEARRLVRRSGERSRKAPQVGAQPCRLRAGEALRPARDSPADGSSRVRKEHSRW